MFLGRRCKITFIAHGATIFSEENRFSDSENYPPLNEAGEEEIEKVCLFLKKRGIKNDKIYSSAGVRAFESADIIAKMYKKDVEIIDDLKPMSCPIWNNMTLQQIIKKHDDSLVKQFENPDERIAPNCESVTEFVQRVGDIIEQLIQKNIGNRVIIVTYPEVIQAAIVAALKLPAGRICSFYIRTGSATQISYFEKLNSLKYSGYLPSY